MSREPGGANGKLIFEGSVPDEPCVSCSMDAWPFREVRKFSDSVASQRALIDRWQVKTVTRSC